MKKLLSAVLCIALLLGVFSPVTPVLSAKALQKSYYVGDIIEFGSYPQSATQTETGAENGYNVEPIKWRILKIENGKALLLSSEIIDAMYYNSTSETVDGYYANNYARSDIRNWLINYFYNTAFSSIEKNCIVATTLDNSASATSINAVGSYTEYSSPPTTDKVFLLSKGEANSYATPYFQTTVTDYAYANGFVPGSGTEPSNHWLLRTAGNNTYQIYTVHVRWGVYTTYYNWNDDTISILHGVRPAIWLDLNAYENKTHTGILEDYIVSVNLDGTGVNWISDMTISGDRYPVKEGVLSLTSAQKLKNNKVYFTLSDNTVVFICALENITEPTVRLYDSLTLRYKNGKFPDRIKKLSGGITNQISALVDRELAQTFASLSLTDITVELLPENTELIYFTNWYGRKLDRIQLSLNETIGPGEMLPFSAKIHVNTNYNFPINVQNRSTKITCILTAKKNGKTVTSMFDYKINLVNEDYEYHNNPEVKKEVKKTWGKQSLADLLRQLQDNVYKCPDLNQYQKSSLWWKISSCLAKDGLANLFKIENEYEILDMIYDMDCYFHGRKYATVATAGEKLLDAIIDECDTKTEEVKKELEKDLKASLGSLFTDNNFNMLINWYGENEMEVVVGNSKRLDVKCPVDILITDEEGITVLSIVNDVVVYTAGGVTAFVNDGKKTIYLPTDIDHNVQIIATDDGTMDYSVTEISPTGEKRVVSYPDVVLTKDKVCSGNIARESMPEEGEYQLTEMVLDKLEFSNASFTLQDDLSLYFGVKESLFTQTGYTEPYVLLDINGEMLLSESYQIVDGEYVFVFNNISPEYVTETIRATLYSTHNGVTYQSGIREFSILGEEGERITGSCVYQGCYYSDGNPVPYAGLVEAGGNYYYVTAKSRVITGRYAISKVNETGVARGIYYFFEDGRMNTEVGVYGGYYYNAAGKSEAYAGLIAWNGNMYYIGGNGGRVITGRYFVSRTNDLVPIQRAYTFYEDGRMLQETLVYTDGFYYEKGIRTPYAGMLEYDGYFYYVGASGKCVTNCRYVATNMNNTGKASGSYWFDVDGKMLCDVIREGRYYGPDGLAPYNVGVVEVDGKFYYNNATNGQLRKDTTFTIAANKTNGLIPAGKYTTDADGVLMPTV